MSAQMQDVEEFCFLSPTVALTVRELGGNPQKKKVHVYESVLFKMPFFKTLSSERWAQDEVKSAEFELPPLSKLEDFASS